MKQEPIRLSSPLQSDTPGDEQLYAIGIFSVAA